MVIYVHMSDCVCVCVCVCVYGGKSNICVFCIGGNHICSHNLFEECNRQY